MAKGTLGAGNKAHTIKVGDSVRMTARGGAFRVDETGIVVGRRTAGHLAGRGKDLQHWVLDVSFPSGRVMKDVPAGFFKVA